MTEKVVIIGAGAAGCMAAIMASDKYDVTIIEKKEKIGKKLSITGKGRCNITFDGDFEYLKSNILENGKFMYSSFNLFDNMKLIEFIEKLGVKVKLERGNRYFLDSDNASELVEALKKKLKKKNIKVIYNAKVESVKKNKEDKFEINIKDKECILADKCVIATGGKSYPATGSEGDGYNIAKSFGHKVSKIKPALVGIMTEDNGCKSMQGLTLKNVCLRVLDNKKEIFNAFGEMLFTHFGVSGPIVLSASSKITRIENLDKKLKNGDIVLSIDLKPALSIEVLDKRICRDFIKYNNKEFKNSLNELFPKSMIKEVIKRSNIDENKKVCEITKKEREYLGYVIKNFDITAENLMPIETGIVTSGGVVLKEINPKTLESKIINNLYFVGEVLDLDAYTGGFNLQIAFSTGYACGYYM